MRFKQHKVKKPYDWTGWVCPTKTYLMKCCDCGLVHEMEFAAFMEANRKGKWFEIAKLPPEVRVMFRMRRAKPVKKTIGKPTK